MVWYDKYISKWSERHRHLITHFKSYNVRCCECWILMTSSPGKAKLQLSTFFISGKYRAGDTIMEVQGNVTAPISPFSSLRKSPLMVVSPSLEGCWSPWRRRRGEVWTPRSSAFMPASKYIWVTQERTVSVNQMNQVLVMTCFARLSYNLVF